MSVRVSITDLRSRIVYRGTLMNPQIQQGQDMYVNLENYPGRVLRIPRLRGWLNSDKHTLWYLNDVYGRRWRMRLHLPRTISIDSGEDDGE